MEQPAFPSCSRLFPAVVVVIHPDIIETSAIVPPGSNLFGRPIRSGEHYGLDGQVQNDPGIAPRRRQADEAQPSLRHLLAARGSE